MSKQWTDADVARMLGWYFEPDGKYRPAKYGQLNLEFGLSTPPSPEADANAARYVLPWLRARFPDNELIKSFQVKINEIISKNISLSASIQPPFSEMICMLALTVYNAKEEDDAK
jgi:hypothetical protein